MLMVDHPLVTTFIGVHSLSTIFEWIDHIIILCEQTKKVYHGHIVEETEYKAHRMLFKLMSITLLWSLLTGG